MPAEYSNIIGVNKYNTACTMCDKGRSRVCTFKGWLVVAIFKGRCVQCSFLRVDCRFFTWAQQTKGRSCIT